MDEQLTLLQSALAGRYAIERELGHGGMATVYLALDVKHDRKVALKVLRPELSILLGAGAERFLREIRISARLDHPHILTLIDSGSDGGVLWYVLPFVRGESLRQKLEREVQLAVEDVLTITMQVASALDHAHRHGVIHRDIKPENILLHEGEAMLADFGIALAIREAGGSRLSQTGISPGTPQYMSPEQASGSREMDARSDVYSLAVVVYEMLTGTPPHMGATAQAIMAKVMTERPTPIRTVRDVVPESMDDAVAKALAKVPADRFAQAGDFAKALSAGTELRPVSWLRPRQWKRTTRGLVATAGIVFVTVLVTQLVRGRLGSAPPAVPHYRQLTFDGRVGDAQISPRGDLLAYIAGVGDSQHLLIRDLSTGTTTKLASVGSVHGSFRWSPDGSFLLYAGTDSAGHMQVETFPRLGGPPRHLPCGGLSDLLSPDGSRLAAWSPAFTRIRLTRLATCDTVAISFPDTVSWFIDGDWSPTGKLIAILARRKTGGIPWALWAGAVDGAGWHLLVEDSTSLSPPRWSPDGEGIYYVAGDELRWLRVASDGAPVGAARVVQPGVVGASSLSLAIDGKKLVYARTETWNNLWLATRKHWGSSVRFSTAQLTRGTAAISPARFSPDGRFIAFMKKEENRANLFTLPTGGGVPQQVTFSDVAASGPAWSPDGRALAFCAGGGSGVKVHTVDLQNGMERTYGRSAPAGVCDLAWAPGRHILYLRPGNRNYQVLDPVTEAESPLVANDFVGWMFFPSYSPDGERVVVMWSRGASGRDATGLWVISLRDSSQSLVQRGGRVFPMGWSADGKAVYAQDHDTGDLILAPVTKGKTSAIGRVPFGNAFCRATDRGRELVLLCAVQEQSADAWMIQDFDPEAASNSRSAH